MRDEFAMAAMQGLLGNSSIYTPRIAKEVHQKMLAALAYLIADEMIAAGALPTAQLNANVAAANLSRDG